MTEFNPLQRPLPMMGGRPQPGFLDAVKTCLMEKYCCFKGRARRAEFWWYMLAMTIVGVVLSTVMMAWMLPNMLELADDPLSMYTSPPFLVSCVFGLAFLLPNLGATVRRLHDTNRSGWWLLLPWAFYIPIIIISILIILKPEYALSWGIVMLLLYLVEIASCIILLVWLCQDSDRGENRYGRSPKYQ